MLASLLIALTFAASTTTSLPAPGDGLGLAPAPRPIPELMPVPLPGWESPAVDGPSPGSSPLRPITAMVAIVAGGLAILAGKTKRGEPGPTSPANVDVIFVPGYGSPATGTFDTLIDGLGLAPHQVHEFDYRTIVPLPDHAAAARASSVGPTAAGIAAMVADLEQQGRWIYLVGFSKGGAAVAHLVARWDSHPDERPARVVGAALLDPPISGGLLGKLQSVGLETDGIPNDGGYDPIEWDFLRSRDTRVNLGQAAGIATMVIRNPDAWPANFSGTPSGLRVYDLEDSGGPGIGRLLDGIDAASERVGEAHASVRQASETVECIRAELWQADACRWPSSTPQAPGPLPPAPVVKSAGGGGVNLVM